VDKTQQIAIQGLDSPLFRPLDKFTICELESRMRVVGRDVLEQAEKEHRGSGLNKALSAWLKVVELADWRNFPDVKNTWRAVITSNPTQFLTSKETSLG